MKDSSFKTDLPVLNPDLNKYQRLAAIENRIPCEAIIDYQVGGNSVGAYLTKEGNNASENFKIIFGFNTNGFGLNLSDAEVRRIFDNVVSTLKQLPMGERITIRLSSHSDDCDRQAYLSDLVATATHPLIALMLLGAKKRTTELKIANKRKPKSIKIFVTFTSFIQENKEYDIGQMTLIWLQKNFQSLWQKFAHTEEIVEREQMDDLLRRGYDQGYVRWQQMLSVSMGLEITPMSSQDLYEDMWAMFNTEECPALPQRVIFDGKIAREEVDSDVHFISHIFKDQKTYPIPDREWMFIKDKFVAPMFFWDKPGGFADERHELGYIADIFNYDAVTDTDCIVQFTRADNEKTKKEMVKIMKHARSDRLGNGDEVVTTEIENLAKNAQQSLYRGDVPIHTAVVFLVKRDTLELLETDCNYLQQCVSLPAEIRRDRTMAYQTIMDTMPVASKALLTYKSSLGDLDMRLTYQTDEAPGFSSLVLPQLLDKKGIEFITREGQVPLQVDVIDQHNNVGLFATTRAGKSVLVAEVFTIAQARGIPIIIVDSPPSDAASTYRDYVAQVGGQYCDIRKHSSNLFQLPDLSIFSGDLKEDKEELQVRKLEFSSFVQKSIMILILGDITESEDPTAVKFCNDIESLIIPALDGFFADDLIIDLYSEADIGGFGSPAWAKMPTLKQFIEYFQENWQKNLSEVELNDDSNKEAASYILKRLRTVMLSPLGACIGRPSTIRDDSNLLCYAMTGLENSPKDIHVLSLAVQAAVLRRTLKSKASVVFFDEVSIQLEFLAIAKMISILCANGAKAGIRVILAMQDPDTP